MLTTVVSSNGGRFNITGKDMGFHINLLCEVVDFCRERSLKPILGIMPAIKTLKK
jgi:hypothetical protein